MGGLNSGPGPGITLLIAFVLILCSNVLSAPLYEEDDTQDSNAQGLIEPQGCYYNFQHYNEGERILTNEPCLNCTCRNRMLMCYLRVCPFTKGIGQNCTVEKVPGQCCPIITCPEVPVQLLTSSTTEHSESDGRRPDVHHNIKGTAVGHLDNNGCQIDGVFYPNGAQVPGNPEKPCELCYCIRNKTACIMQECALHVDGCRPVYEDGQCFPVRYQCDDQPYEEEPTTTIRPAPTPGLIITTTSSEPLECFYNNEIYEDGSRIQTEDPCEHCYCLKGKIACAVQECGAPLEKEGQNCTALPPAPGKCCPDSYQCDITMSSQKFGQGSEGTTEAGFSSVADAGHPTDSHYPGEQGATKTTEKPKYGTNQFNELSGGVTEGLIPDAITPSKEVSGKPPVSPDGQKPHLDKVQPGSQDSSDLEHHEELDKGTQLPTKHQDSMPNEYEGTPEDVSSVSGEQKITSADETKPGATKRPVHGTKPETVPSSSGLPTIPGSLNEFIQRQNQSQTDPIHSVHHTDHKDKPHGQKPEHYGDEKVPVSGSKPQEPSSLDGTKVQDGIQTTEGSRHPPTETEHILHVMEQQKPAPGIESHVQDTSSTKRPFDEGLSTLNADSTEKAGSTKPSYGGHWKPQPGIYQPDLHGTPFDVSQEQMSPDRTKPVFPEGDKLPEDNYGYSTPIPAIDEDQNVKGPMTVSNAKDQLIDKLHNIIQDVQAQVNDGKTTEMPEEADYKTTTQSQKGHFTEKPDTIPHLHHGSQESHHPLGSGHDVSTTKPMSDKETQQGNAVTDTPKDTNDIFNKIQGIIHGMFTQVTEAVQTTLAPLTTGEVDGKKPSEIDEASSSARPEHKPDTTHELKPFDGSSKHPQETKPTDSHGHPDKVGVTGAPDDSDKHPQGSGLHYPQGSTKHPGYTESTTHKHGSTQTRYPDGLKPVDSEYPSITQYPDYISPDGETDDYGKYPGGSKPMDSGKYPYSTEYPEEAGATIQPEEHGHKTKPLDKEHGTKYPQGYIPTEHPMGQSKFPEGMKPTYYEIPSATDYPDDKTTDSHQNKYPERFKPSASKPHSDEKYPQGTKPIGSDNYPFGTEYPEGVGLTGRPQDVNKYPSGSQKYPDELGSTMTPDTFGKYPDKTSPVKGTDGVKYPEQIGSTDRPHYSSKYPGSKYPEGFTGKPTDSEDEPYGTEHPQVFDSTGRPQDLGKYPDGTKPSYSQKYPHGTEYPNEVGSTITPDDFGKYPDGTVPVKGSEGVKYPGQSGSTGRPHYTTKYPGSKYPEGITDKPTGSEDEPHGTEYPEESGVTGRPHDLSKYPEGSKPTGSQKRPYYPHGTEYPDEVGSTVTPDELGKYPDGTAPDKESEGVKHPGETQSSGRPHHPTTYPGSKYPERVTGKPTGSEDEPQGTEYSEESGVTGRPDDLTKYPEGSKPIGSQKHPHYPHGTEYPDEVGSTVTPDEFGKYPDGTVPVKGSEGVKYPGQSGSTGRPHYTTKYPGSKYPEGITGKPTGSEDEPQGTEYPEVVGVTGRPHGTGKYPEGVKPSHSESDVPYGTEYPEGETETDRPHDLNKYPEGTKPVRGPDGVVYPGQTGSTGRPQVEDQYLEGTRPTQSEGHPLGTEYPDKEIGTDRPYGANKRPTGFRPNEKYPGGSVPTGTELPEYSTVYPNEYDSNVTPDVLGKYPHESKPVDGIHRPDGTKYPDHKDTSARPHYPGKYPGGFDPAQKPQGANQHSERPTGTERDPYVTDHPEGEILTGKPHDMEVGSTSRPDDSNKYPYQTEYPEGFTGIPDDLSQLPDGSRPVRPVYRPQDFKHPTGKPFDSTRFPVGSRPTFRPIESGKYPESSTQISGEGNLYGTQSPYESGVTSKPQTTGKYPSDVSKYPDGSKPTYLGKHPSTGGSESPHDSQTDHPEGFRPSGSPHVTSKYPQGSKPSDKYPFGTEYPEGVGSTVQPNEYGKYPDGTSPVKGAEDIKHPDQTGSTGRPHYQTKYPGSKYPEGFTGKPSDPEDQYLGTEYPEQVGVTGRPQIAGKYPEGTKPTHSDSERPYGTEYPEGQTDRPYDSTKYPDGTKPEGVNYPGKTGSTGRPHYSTKYPGSKFPGEVTNAELEPHGTNYPEDVGATEGPEYSEKYPEKLKPVGKPDELDKYPGGDQPSGSNQLPGGEVPVKHPEGEESGTGRPYDPNKYPEGYRPDDRYPEDLKPTDSHESTKGPDATTRHPDDGASPESVTDQHHEVGSTTKVSTDRPDLIKHPEGYKPTNDTQDATKHPGETKPTNEDEFKPDTNIPSDQNKHGKPGEEGLKPEQSEKTPDDSEYLDKQGTTGKPYDSSRHPAGAQQTSSDKYPFITKNPDEEGLTTKPDDFGKQPGEITPGGKPDEISKFPEGEKPEDVVKHPQGVEHPTDEAGTDRPYDASKYPEETKPVRGPDGVKHPEQIGSTGRPHYSSKYPGSEYPEGFTGKPTGSEDEPYGNEHPQVFDSTGRPQDLGKYPDGTKPSYSQKYPHGTEYPNEVGSTITPDDFGKYPDGTVPVKGSEGVKYPGQSGTTGRPHYTTRYPGSKYPEGITGKPTGSEHEPHGTEYPEESGVTGRPHDLSKYPDGSKPIGSQKRPYYPHGTEYPDEVGSTVTPDDFGKYPDGTVPDKESEGVKHPGETQSSGRPHYPTTYPGSKYPERVTGKPTGSEDEPQGTEYPEESGVTGRPDDLSKYPEGSKPIGSQKHPHYPHGTEYPDEVGSTVTPDEVGKYPDGTVPVKESEGVKYPGQSGSTGRPHYTTKYPGSKYPEGITGKPTGSEDEPQGAEYPEVVGVTGRPHGTGKYPEGVKPSHSESDVPYGTEYPEGETGTDRPHDLNKYPEGTKPVRGPDGVVYPGQTGSTARPQGVSEYPEEGKPISEDKYPDGVKPTSPNVSHGTQYPDALGGSGTDPSTSTPSVHDFVSKQPGSMYLPQFPQTGKPFSPADDKDKPLELPEESYSAKPGHDGYGSSTPKGSEFDSQTGQPKVPVSDHSVDEMDVTTHSPDEYPKRPDSADLTHDSEYTPQLGEQSSKHPSKTSTTQSPHSNLDAQYPSTKEPSTEQDGKVAPHGTKAPQDDSLATRPGSESPHTEKPSSGVSTPKYGSSETERPVQGLSGHDQSTTDQYGSPVKHPDDEQGNTSPGSVNIYSESSDEYSTPEYSNQDRITGKPSGTHTDSPVEHPSRPGQEGVYTTKRPNEGRPTHGEEHPEGVLPGSEGFDGSEHTPVAYETTTLGNDDLINKLQSIISGIQTQVTNDKTTRQPSDFSASFGQPTEMPHEGVGDDKRTTPSSHHQPSPSGELGEQKPEDHSEYPHESDEYATDKPYISGDKRRPIIGFEGTKPHGTDKPLGGSADEFTTGLGEETTEGYLEEENEIHDPEGHFGKKPQGTKKPSFGFSTEFPETGRPTDTKHPDVVSSHHPDLSVGTESSLRPSEETVGSQSTKHPEGYTDHPTGKPHDTSVQTHDEDKPTSSTGEYPEEGKRPDKVPASGEKVTGKPDDSIHFPDEKPDGPTSESSTPGISDEHKPTRKTGSTQVGSDDVSSTTSYDSEKPEVFDSSTKEPGTHHDIRPTLSQTEGGDYVHGSSSTPKDGVLGVTDTPGTSDEAQKGVTKPGGRPGVHQPSRPDDDIHSHGEEKVPIYHGVESMAGKPTDQPDSMIGEDHTLLSEEDSAGTKKPIHSVPVDEETGQVTESEMTVDSQDHKHPSQQEPTDKPLHVVYPTYYPDGIITRKPGSRPQDLGNKVTVTPQSNVYGTSTPSREGDDTTQSVGDEEVMKPTSKVPTDGSSVSLGEPVTEGLDTEGSTKRITPQEGEAAGKPHVPVDKHPDSSSDVTQGSDEFGTASPVIIIEEVHTEVHSERATTKPGTESYDQTTKFVTSSYPHGSDESLTEKPETFDGKTTKNPDLYSHRTDSVFQEKKPGYGSTVHPLSTDRPQDSLHHTSQPGHGSSVPVSGITEPYPDVLVGSTTDETLHQGTGKPVYQTKYPESLDGKSTNEPGLVTDGTTPSAIESGQPGSQHVMNLYTPKDKYSTTISPELVKGTQQPGSFTSGSRVPGVTEEGSLYTTSKPDDSHQGPTFDHEIFGSKFPGRKTTQKPLVTPEAQPDFTTVFGVGTTREPQEGVTSTPTQGMNVEHNVPSFIFPQKQPEDGVTSTEGYITQGKPLTTMGQPGVIFEGKQTTPSYQFITSGTHDPEISTKKPFQPSVKGASYVPYKIIDGRKVYYPENEVAHKPDEADKHGFDGFDYLPYEIINGKKFFKPNEISSQSVPTSTTPKHRLGMYVPYKIINGKKVYYTEDPQGKPHAGVEDYDGLDYVPFDIINGTKVFYPEAVNEPTSPTSQETTTTPSYIMAMYVPYKIINGTKVYYPEDSPNKPESEDYDGLDYVPFEIVNGKKVFYPERVATPPKGTSTPSYVMAMYVPYKIINGTKVYYPEDPQGKPQGEDYDGLDYVPFEIVNGTKVFYPERVTATPEATTKPAHVMAMYVPYKIINGTKVYYPEEPQVGSEEYDGLDYVPFEMVNGTKVFHPEKASTTSSYESTTTPSYPSAMYVPYKIVDGRKVYYPKYAQYKPYKVPEGFAGFDYIPYEIVDGSKVFYPDRATTLRPTVPPTKHHQGMYVPYKIVNGTKIYYPKDAEEKPQGVLDGYDGSDYVPYEIVNGTQVFYPEKATTEKPGIKAMYVPYKIVDGTKVYYAKDAQPTPNLIPKGYDGFDFVPYEIVNGTKTFYPERVTTPAPNELYYTQGMYVPYKIVDGRKVYYPQRAQHNPLHIPEGYEGFDYLLYDIVNGTKVFHPERGTASPAPTHAPSGTFYPQGMYVPFRVINGTKVFYPHDAQHRPDPMKNDYDGWQHLPYDIVNGTKVFYPERVTTEAPIGQVSAMYLPFKMINGTKVFYANDAQYQPYLIPEGYDGFEYVPYEIVNGTKMFYPDRAIPTSGHLPTTVRPIKQGMFVPYKIINGAKVYYPKHASDNPHPPSSEYNGVDFIPYEVINGTKVFYPDRIQGPELETSGTKAMYVPYKLVNGTKVFYPKDAQFKPYLIPEGYDGFDYLPYEVKNGTKVFYPERLTVTQKPEQVPTQGMFVPYKMINGQKVYYPKEAQKRPHPLSSEYDGLDYIPYEIVNGTKVFYPEYVTQSADMSGTPMSQAMYVPYKIINGTKVFYPKYAQHKPHLVPDGYDGFEYVPYKIVNGTKFFYPDRVVTQPQKLQGMYVPYKIINGTKVFYPKYAQPTLQQLPKGFDGIDYIPYEIVNGTKVFYPEKATPSGVSGTPVVQALYVPYKIINGKKVFYTKYALERPQTIPEGYDGFAYMPYSIVNGTKMFYPEQAQFPGVSKVPSLQGTFVPYKLLNSTKVFYPKYANDESPRVPDGYDGVDYVPYEQVNGTKVFYPELISPQASSGTSPVPGKYVPYKVVNGKKVFYPKEGKPQYPSGGVRYPYDGIVYVPYKSLSGTSPSRPENYPPFVTPEHSLYGQNSEIVYVDDDDESFRPQFISQSRPSQEQTGGHIGHVPGEGSCFLNNKTYENNMEISPVSPCQSRCRCINSIVRCVRIKCPPLPQTNTANCSPVYDEGSCCPTYSCEHDDLDYLTTTEYPGSQDSSEYPGSSSTVISFGQGFDSTTQFAVTDASPHKPLYGQDEAGDFSGEKPHPSRKPVTSDGQHPTDQYHIHRPQKPKPSEQGSLEPYDGVEGHPMPGEFSGEDDYDGEDEEPYGPGTCRYAGKVYVSAQQIPRDDPCDFCFCFRSDIICLQQSCPPPIPGCRDEPIQGFCCPRYECHVKMATLLNVTSTTTTTTTTLPPHFFLHPYKGSATRTGCFVQGKAYRVGQAIPSASGPCMDCICRGNGRMECEPKVCTPEPMIRKMIVPAENTTSPSSER